MMMIVTSVSRYDCVAVAVTTALFGASIIISICCPVVVPITAFNLLSLDGGGRGTTTSGGSFSTTRRTTSRTVLSNLNLKPKEMNRGGYARSSSSTSSSSISNNNHNYKHKLHVLGGVSLLAEEQEVPTATAIVDEGVVIKKNKKNKKGKIQQQQLKKQHPLLVKLDPKDTWIANLDYDAFGKDVTSLGKQLLKKTGDDDVYHLNKIVRWRNIAAVIGLGTVWMTPNPITAVALSTWSYASWTMIAHHTCHGGYNKCNSSSSSKGKRKSRFTSRGFGLGLQNRFIDWLDWMLPEAWNIEHNRLHHYRLNEEKGDPDLVQRNFKSIRDNTKLPYFVKYGITAMLSTIWKWYYYAPNTYKELKVNEWRKSGKKLPVGFDPDEAVTILALFKPSNKNTLHQIFNFGDVIKDVLGPLLFGRYVIIPAVLFGVGSAIGSGLGLGRVLATNAIINLLVGELLTNIHSFATIVTNHSGEDMYTFDDAVIPKTGSFYVRQVVGSVNYNAGNDLIDFSHGFLNYQIEHHVWPHLSMLQYQRGAPQLKAICQKHGVPYVQENVFERVRKTLDVAVGKTSMRIFPTEYEPVNHKAGIKGITWKSTNGAIDDDDE